MTLEIIYMQLEILVKAYRNVGYRWQIIRHALDTKDKHILADPNPIHVPFKDIKKFEAQNTINGKVLTLIKTSKLSDKKNKEH